LNYSWCSDWSSTITGLLDMVVLDSRPIHSSKFLGVWFRRKRRLNRVPQSSRYKKTHACNTRMIMSIAAILELYPWKLFYLTLINGSTSESPASCSQKSIQYLKFFERCIISSTCKILFGWYDRILVFFQVHTSFQRKFPEGSLRFPDIASSFTTSLKDQTCMTSLSDNFEVWETDHQVSRSCRVLFESFKFDSNAKNIITSCCMLCQTLISFHLEFLGSFISKFVKHKRIK
jgi:hypothetical protein